MKGFAIAFQALHMARSAHAIALESEFRIKRRFNLMRGVAAIANRTPNVTRFEELTMNAFVIDIFNQYVALTARFWDVVLANLRVRMRVGKNVMDTVAIVASRSYHKAVHQQSFSMDGVYEMCYRLLLTYGMSFQNRFLLVASSARLMEIKFVGSGVGV